MAISVTNDDHLSRRRLALASGLLLMSRVDSFREVSVVMAVARPCDAAVSAGVRHWSFLHQPGSFRPPEPRLMTSTAAAATH